MKIQIKSLGPDLLNDYLDFFDNMKFTENPNWSICYCYSFHFTGPAAEWTRGKNRESVIRLIREHKLRGYLAYAGNKPVGWCNANDRMNFQSLSKYYDIELSDSEKVCSVVCFLVSPPFRRKGIAKLLLSRVCEDYQDMGYDWIEAYPGKGKLSCERHYKGPPSLYENTGFHIKSEYKDYYIVRKNLSNK